MSQIHYFTYTITKEEEGQPVRAVLYGGMELSTRKIRSLKKMPDGILLDGRPVTVREIVAAGQRLQIRMEDDAVSAPLRGQGGAAEDMRTVATHGEKERCRDGYLRILYEDADLLFVNKPSGMVCHPSKGHRGDSIYDQIRAYYGRTGQNAGVHLFGRLDKDTSGIVGIAKNKMTADRMQRQRQQGRFQKEYLALVWGQPPATSGTITIPMEEDRSAGYLRMRAGTGPAAKSAVTHYTVVTGRDGMDSCGENSLPAENRSWLLCENRPWTLCRVNIETGRTHQIRFHMAAIGCPLAGDALYGTLFGNVEKERPGAKRDEAAQQGSARQGPAQQGSARQGPAQQKDTLSGQPEHPQICRAALHAWKVTFFHPYEGREITVTAPLSEDMRAAI